MLAFAFKGFYPLIRTLFEEFAALVAKLAARAVNGLALAALNRQRQNGPAPAAGRRLFIDRTVALGAYHEWRAFRGTIVSAGNWTTDT